MSTVIPQSFKIISGREDAVTVKHFSTAPRISCRVEWNGSSSSPQQIAGFAPLEYRSTLSKLAAIGKIPIEH